MLGDTTYSPETSSGMCSCYLEAKLSGLFPEELDLLLVVSSFVVFRTFVYVMLTILQHSIDESGEAMSHGGDGFGSAELAAQASVLRAKVRLAFQ
jgi:hypothetical protein